jgi:hypothetical protein
MILRFLLRFLLVPLGGLCAAVCAIAVVVSTNWQNLQAMFSEPKLWDSFLMLVLWGPFAIALVPLMGISMLALATTGVIISEIFAIRSFLYHVTNGALATWIGWAMRPTPNDAQFLSDPTFVITGGIAAGLVYWLIAGWSAGFWKPVFRPSLPPSPTAARA